jgi:hypothetical protein
VLGRNPGKRSKKVAELLLTHPAMAEARIVWSPEQAVPNCATLATATPCFVHHVQVSSWYLLKMECEGALAQVTSPKWLYGLNASGLLAWPLAQPRPECRHRANYLVERSG